MPTMGWLRGTAAHRAVEPGVAEGEDPAVQRRQPVAPAVGRGRHGHDRARAGAGCRASRSSRRGPRRRPRRRPRPASSPRCHGEAGSAAMATITELQRGRRRDVDVGGIAEVDDPSPGIDRGDGRRPWAAGRQHHGRSHGQQAQEHQEHQGRRPTCPRPGQSGPRPDPRALSGVRHPRDTPCRARRDGLRLPRVRYPPGHATTSADRFRPPSFCPEIARHRLVLWLDHHFGWE